MDADYPPQWVTFPCRCTVWTATARHADLVFPSALPIERDDIAAASRDNWIVRSTKVQEPPEGIETDHAILARIAGRLGFDAEFRGGRTEAEWISHLYDGYRAAHPELPEWDDFCAEGHARIADLTPEAVVQPLEMFFGNPAAHPLSTPSGRIELLPAAFQIEDSRLGGPLSQARPSDLEEDLTLPLRLLSPQPETRLHSQLDGAPAASKARRHDCEIARAHPDDIHQAGLSTGSRAFLSNGRGTVLVVIVADNRVAPGHVVLPTGGWYRPTLLDGRNVDAGGNPNTLTRDAGASELSLGASAGGARVQLRPCLGGMCPFQRD